MAKIQSQPSLENSSISALSKYPTFLYLTIILSACSSPIETPSRPASVSKTAIWAGGVDGGAWIDCVLDPTKNANWCTVWDDSVGDVWARTHFVLQSTGQPLDLQDIQYTSFSGTFIKLDDGRVLEPLVLHDRKPGTWDQPVIEPERPELLPEN